MKVREILMNIGKPSDEYHGVHGGKGFGSHNTEGERILKFSNDMETMVFNTLLKRREDYLHFRWSRGPDWLFSNM